MKRMHYSQVLLFALSLLLLSCSKEGASSIDNSNVQNNDIQVVDGHLSFPTNESLESYLSNLMDAEDELPTKSSSGVLIDEFPGFTSLANRKAHILTKSKASLDDCDEMSQEEYDIMVLENLLVDPVLENIVDTNMVISVDGRIFKITEYGTFSAETSHYDNVIKAIDAFDSTLVKSLSNGETILLSDGVTSFTNSFGNGSTNDYIASYEDPDNYDFDEDYNYSGELGSQTKAPLATSAKFNNNFHSGYGTVNYSWSNSSAFLKFLDKIRGKEVSRENYFDDTHRVKVTLYDVNYAFYASAGINVKMEKQKKFWFIKYWVDENAEKIAIGFNKVYGIMKFNNPRSYSNIAPTTSKYWSKFTGKINNITSEFIHGLTQMDFLKAWCSDNIFVVLPSFTLFGNTYKNIDIGNKLFDTAETEVFKFLKSQANKYTYDVEKNLKKQVQPKDPRIAYFVWGNTSTSYNAEKPFAMGVKEYPNLSNKRVVFDWSVGFTINSGSWKPSGFVPTEFDIEEIDAFGAAYYGGKWAGVRFVSE